MSNSGRVVLDHGLRSDGIHLFPIPKLHSHSELEFNWIERGWVEYTTMSGIRRLEKGQLFCFWGAFPHQIIRMSKSIVGYWITVPHEEWLTWEMNPDCRQSLLSGQFQPLEYINLEQLRKWKKEIQLGETNTFLRKATLRELEACLMRSTYSKNLQNTWKNSQSTLSDNASPQAHAANLVRKITTRYLENLSIASLAKEEGISPEYATTMFKQVMGISLKSYLLYMRIAHAKSLLISTSKSITEIGYASGFNTLSRFYAAFKADSFITPKEYRSAHRKHPQN